MPTSGSHPLDGIMKMLERPPWDEAFAEYLAANLQPVCDRFGIELLELPELLSDAEWSNLWGSLFEDFLTLELEGLGNPVDHYLKRRGWKESAGRKAYMKSLRDSTLSIYEVSEIRPGESMLVRDLIRGGEPVLVHEKTATRMLRPWEHLAARVVQVRDKAVLGGGVLPVSHELSEELVAMAQGLLEIRNKPEKLAGIVGADNPELKAFLAGSDQDFLRSAAPMLIMSWLTERLEAICNPRPLQIVNAEGDEVEFVTLRYRLKPKVTQKKVRAVLDTADELQAESAKRWNWVEDRPENAAGPGASPSEEEDDEADGDHERMMHLVQTPDGRPILGSLELKGRELIVHVNSRRRAERMQAMLDDMLAGLVGKPEVEYQSIDEIGDGHAQDMPDEDEPEDLTNAISLEEQRDIVHLAMDAHYSQLLQQPVPALGNVSPLQLAESGKGQEKLVKWLKKLEQAIPVDPEDPMSGYDTRWLWEELGVAHLRK